MPEHTPGGHALAGGVFLTESLAVIVNSSPVVHASDLCLRPGQGRTDRQRPGTAAHVQKLSLSVKIQIGKDGVVDALHHSSTAERVLPPDPAAPAEQQQQ